MSKPKNVVEKFNAWFKRLPIEEQRDLYDLLAMIRGPDNDDPDDPDGSYALIKNEITCKIRFILGLWDDERDARWHNGLDRSYHPFLPSFNTDPFPTYAETKKIIAPFGHIHYHDHATQAIDDLTRLGIIKKEPKEPVTPDSQSKI